MRHAESSESDFESLGLWYREDARLQAWNICVGDAHRNRRGVMAYRSIGNPDPNAAVKQNG